MKKFFLRTLYFVTLSLFLASCGDKGNEPEFAYFGADKFTIEFSEITSTSFKVTVTPNDPEMYYSIGLLPSKHLVDQAGNPYPTFQEALNAYCPCTQSIYENYFTYWRMKGEYPRTFNNQDPDTEYFVVVYQVTPEYKYKILAYKSVKTLPEGMLPGVFSVGANKQVRFSQGNLQGTVRAYPMEPKWYFAENQWDIIGNNMSARTELFSWNTISQYSSFADWKNSSIENGNKGNTTWRLLSADEWLYLFRTRTNAEKLFAFGKVEGVNGLILLPDNWDNTIKPVNLATENGMYWQNEEYWDGATGSHYCESNDYSTATQWKDLADLGAVFLPAAGYNYQVDTEAVNEVGCYLTPTTYDDVVVAFLSFDGSHTRGDFSYITPADDGFSKADRYSLRLVTDVK